MSSVGSGHRDPRPASRARMPGHRGGPQRVQRACVEDGGAGPAVSSRPVSPGSSLRPPGPACLFLATALAGSCVTWGRMTGSRGGGCGAEGHRRQRQGRGGADVMEPAGGWGAFRVLLSCPLGCGRVRWASVLSAVIGVVFPESNPAPGGRLCGISALTAVHTHHPPPPPRLCSRDAAAPRASPEGSDFPLVTGGLHGAPGLLPGLKVPALP